MVDLISLLNELVDSKGNILIPGISDDVLPLDEKEKNLYTSIDFSQVLLFIISSLTFEAIKLSSTNFLYRRSFWKKLVALNSCTRIKSIH